MKSWNFTTLEQVVQRVTANKSQTDKSGRRGFRCLNIPAIVLTTAAILAGTGSTSYVQAKITGTSQLVDLPMSPVKSNEAAAPPFKDHFAEFFTDDFLASQRANLQLVRKIGTSLDTAENAQGVVSALAARDPHQEWKPVTEDKTKA